MAWKWGFQRSWPEAFFSRLSALRSDKKIIERSGSRRNICQERIKERLWDQGNTPEANWRKKSDICHILKENETDHEERPLPLQFKQQAIMLSRYLQKLGCQTHHAQANAGLLIVQTAVESTRRARAVFVGNDNDLLILLCYYTEISA